MWLKCKFLPVPNFLRSWCLLQDVIGYIPIPLGIAGPLNGCWICPYSHGHCSKAKKIAAPTKEMFDGIVIKAKTISSRRPLRTFSTKDTTTTTSIRHTTRSAITSEVNLLEEIKEDLVTNDEGCGWIPTGCRAFSMHFDLQVGCKYSESGHPRGAMCSGCLTDFIASRCKGRDTRQCSRGSHT